MKDHIFARRKQLEKELKISLDNIGYFSQDSEKIEGHSCENFIGCAQIPMGVAGPILVNGKKHYLPCATTEGALVASVNRGCKASRESGGIRVICENVGITRGPVFKTRNLAESFQFVEWIHNNTVAIRKVCESTSSHLKLIKINSQIVGKNVFLRFSFDTGDAMGMNMATIAADDACAYILEKYNGARLISLSGNYCIDKKPSWLNFINGRGKKVWAEIIISEKKVEEIFHTSPKKIVEVVSQKNLLGSVMAGSMGFNAHFANVVAAIFLATGQDSAHVVEGSLGITTAEIEKNGDLYFSCYLPDLICGTVGGGTGLKTQKEAFQIMKVEDGAIEFAEVIGAAVLAGELSLAASLAEGSLAKAHEELGRGKD